MSTVQRLTPVFVVAAAAIAAGVWFGGQAPEPPPIAIERGPEAVTGRVTVHVSGPVADPGLVRLAPGSRVADALAAAGGVTAEADLVSLNLAAPVVDGSQVVVPLLQPGGAANPGGIDDSGIHVNSADVVQLQQLPGVGPVLAQRIADYRDTNGPFVTVEDLLDVPGIGEGKLAALRDAVTIP
jgi:competence protein ComEA